MEKPDGIGDDGATDEELVRDYAEELEDLIDEWPEGHHERGVTFDALLQVVVTEAQRRSLGKKAFLAALSRIWDAKIEFEEIERRVNGPGGEA